MTADEPSRDAPRARSRVALLAALIDGGVIIAAGAFAKVLAWVFAQRVGFPYALEWLDNSMLQHALKVARGLAIYVTPTLEFTPLIYPPVFSWLGALAVQLGGPTLVPLRVISIASTVVSAFLLYRIARMETRSHLAGVLSAGLFLAMYRISGSFYDIARVDALFLALVLAGVYLARTATRPAAWATAGAVFAVAALTKHPAALVVAALSAEAVLRNRRGALAMPIAFGVILAGVSISIDISTGGMFSYYMIVLPGGDPWSAEIFLNAFTKDLLGPLPIAIAASLGFLAASWMARREWLFWAALLVAAAAGSGWSRAHVGGASNTLMPAYATLALLGGIGFGAFRTWASRLPESSATAARALAGLVALVQFAGLVYTPWNLTPSARDTAANVSLVRRMTEAGGEVFAPYDDYLAYQTGQRSLANASAIENVDRVPFPVAVEMRAALDREVVSKRYALIVLDYPPWRTTVFEESYRLIGVIPAAPGAPVLGWHASDRRLYVRR